MKICQVIEPIERVNFSVWRPTLKSIGRPQNAKYWRNPGGWVPYLAQFWSVWDDSSCVGCALKASTTLVWTQHGFINKPWTFIRYYWNSLQKDETWWVDGDHQNEPMFSLDHNPKVNSRLTNRETLGSYCYQARNLKSLPATTESNEPLLPDLMKRYEKT